MKTPPINKPTSDIPDGSVRYGDIIKDCFLILDIADPTKVVPVNLHTGPLQEFKMSMTELKTMLNDETLFNHLAATRVVYAKFAYEPHTGQQLRKGNDGLWRLNIYKPPFWKAPSFYFGGALPLQTELPEIYSLFLDHLTDGDAASKEYILDWFAVSIQGRNQTVLALMGTQGIGKGVLYSVGAGLHGERNSEQVRDQVFKSQFNGPLQNKTLVNIDEIDLKDKEANDRLKALVNSKIEIERKGKDPVYVPNYGNYIVSSNDYDAVKLEANDRRFSIVQLTDVLLRNTPLMPRLKELTSEENIRMLAHYLMGRVPQHEMLNPFVSARTEEVKEAGLSGWAYYFVMEWAPNNKGRTLPLHEAQAVVHAYDQKSRPGRGAFEKLAKLYNAVFRVRKKGSSREIEVLP